MNGHGCSYCKESNIEKLVKILLNNYKIIFFNNFRGFKWLKNKNTNGMELDFYLPDYNIAIECQGIQHFISIDFFGGKKEFEKLKNRDYLKKQLCKENNISLY